MNVVRAMRRDDIDAVLQIQARCYNALEPESAESLLSKLDASPDTCWVADSERGVGGYLFAHPWTSHEPPALDLVIRQLPASADCFYFHDLAIDPRWRGTGTAERLVKGALQRAEREWQRCALIAVQASQPFWRRFGFVSAPAALQQATADYGEAVLMWRDNLFSGA